MLSRINAWIVERLAKSAGDPPIRVAVQPSGLRMGTGQGEIVVPWPEVTRIVAFTRTGGIGDTMCLALEIAGGRVLELTDTMAKTKDMADQLGAHIPLAMSPSEWRTRLLAQPTDPVVVYEKAAGEAPAGTGVA